MAKLVFHAGSAVMLQFPYSSDSKRLRAIRAFRAIGSSQQFAALERFGAKVIRFLGYGDRRVPWWRRLPWCGEIPLIEQTFPGLDDVFLTSADYRGMGRKQTLKRRGVRVVARPLNGPMIRGVGGTDGDIDIIFWRLDTAAWREFFIAIDLDPDDPYKNCPPGVSLMPRASSDNNFLEPLNFC